MTVDPAGPPPVLVLGLGNLLLTDDGVGLELLVRLRAEFGDHPRVEFVDGGTQGIYLTRFLEGRRAVLVLDAVALGAAAGEVHVLSDAQRQAAQRQAAQRQAAQQQAAQQQAAPQQAAQRLAAQQQAAPRGNTAHEGNVSELLAAAELLGDCPDTVAVVGVEPAVIRTGAGLSDVVRGSLPDAVAQARRVLDELVDAAARERGAAAGERR